MSFRPIRSSQRYLSVDLNACTAVCPDWLLVFFELLRQQKIQSLAPGNVIEIRRPIWDAAGVKTLDRRKKVMDHLERALPNDVVSFERHKGRAPNAIVGIKMADFQSKASPQTLQFSPQLAPSLAFTPV